MSIPYIPLYVSDYEADTAHLTLEEDGAYNRLLRLCWRTADCSIPDDPKWIMRKLRVTADDYYRVVEPVIDEFFVSGMERVFQPRLQKEYEKAKKFQKQRSEAGKASAKSRALKTKDKVSTSVAPPLQQLEPEPELKDIPPKSPKGDFDEFWNAVPRKVGKGAAQKAYLKAVKKVAPEILLSGIQRYAKTRAGQDHQYTVHPSRWLNEERWADEQPSLKPVAAKPTRETVANNIKSGLSFLCASVTPSQARTLIEEGLVTREECKAVGVTP